MLFFTPTVGVAPGTTTMQFSGLGAQARTIELAPQRALPCAPEESRWFMPDRAMDPTVHTNAYPNGFQGLGQQVVRYDLYQRDIWKLRGLGQPKDNIRWDLIAVVGGGAFVVALATSLIANALR